MPAVLTLQTIPQFRDAAAKVMAHIWMINRLMPPNAELRLNCLLRVNIPSEILHVQTFHCLTP